MWSPWWQSARCRWQMDSPWRSTCNESASSNDGGSSQSAVITSGNSTIGFGFRPGLRLVMEPSGGGELGVGWDGTDLVGMLSIA